MNLNQYRSGSALYIDNNKKVLNDSIIDFFASTDIVQVGYLSTTNIEQKIYNVIIDGVRDNNQEERHEKLWKQLAIGGIYIIQDARGIHNQKWLRKKINNLMTTKETTSETDYESITFHRNAISFEKKMRASSK